MPETKDVLEKKILRISGCETKQMANGGYMSKLKGDDNLSYTLFHTKKDGTESKAFQVLKTLPMSGIGTTVELLYKEEDCVSQRDNKTYKSRKAIGMRKVEGSPEPKTVQSVIAGFDNKKEDGDFDLGGIPF